MSRYTKPLSPKRRAVLSYLAAQSAAVATAAIHASCDCFDDSTDASQVLGAMRTSGQIEATQEKPLMWQITDAGRAALTAAPQSDAAAAPKKTKKRKVTRAKAAAAAPVPHDDAADASDAQDAAEQAEAEAVDFALWDSGVLQIQVGEEHFCIPKSQVGRLRDYLNSHAPREVITLGGPSALGFVLSALRGLDERRPADRPQSTPAAAPAPAAPPAVDTAPPAPVQTDAADFRIPSFLRQPPGPGANEATGQPASTFGAPQGVSMDEAAARC